ncbi:hypothetical protein PSHT_01622 [Puccinia striiformis]|uniref:Retrovirus-related Pol polyprotein from transposon TNT 1-94-like beta-barrel domain-containing protein n=1 Tax=Puccinia striiformis TaxID=27350 RepID=A0A2S4WK36_9BASI|nr:hypothetical protein PSHT_01622 [Puccinia striiformis]
MASSTLPSGQKKRSNSVGRSNWQLGDITGTTRLAEDIAILNQKPGSSPPTPEDTANDTTQKGKTTQSNHQGSTVMNRRAIPPHLKNHTTTPTHTPFPGSSLPRRVPITPAPQHAPLNDQETIVKELQDFEEAEFHLKQNKLVQSAIQSSSAIFKSRNILKADGSISWSSSQLNPIPKDGVPKDPHPPSKHQEHAWRLADYYRPKYAQAGHQSTQQSHSATPQASTKGGVSAHLVEAWSLPDDLDGLGFNNMALAEDLVSNVAVFDTGASHGFTGSKFLLYDFRPLSKPIGVSVATNGAGSFITRMGSLKFQAPDGRVIVLRQVLYCEQAKTTLISMAALRKANVFVAYDNNTDTFRITRSNGKHLFDCAFEPSKNRWYMPYPMIRSDVVSP